MDGADDDTTVGGAIAMVSLSSRRPLWRSLSSPESLGDWESEAIETMGCTS